MSQPQKSDYADLLNALDAMANSPAYALRRSVIRQAETVIVSLEERIIKLKEQISEHEKASEARAKETVDPYTF